MASIPIRELNRISLAQSGTILTVYFVRTFAFVFCFGWLCAQCAAQHYPILSVAESPKNIYALFQDRETRLWVGTKDDLFCFDGERFYSLRGLGFPKESVISLAEDSDGAIWIGTEAVDFNSGAGPGGVYRYFSGHVEKIYAGDVLSVVSVAPGVMLVSFGHRKNLFMGDLYRFTRNRSGWAPQLIAHNSAIFVTVDDKGTAYYPCPGGLCALTREQITQWPKGTVNPLFDGMTGASFPDRILHDRSGNLWIRYEIAGSVRYQGHSGFQTIAEVAGKVDSFCNILEAPDGSILMLGDLVYGIPGAFHVAKGRNGLPTGVNTALIAKDGTIWLGTDGGLYRFMYPFRIEYWNEQNGVESPYSVLRKGDRVYAANSGIYELDHNRQFWNQLPNADKLGTVVSLVDGPGKTLYAASLIRGATELDVEGKVLRQTPYGPGGASITTDSRGTIWLAGAGLSRIVKAGGKLAYVPEVPGSEADLDVKSDRTRDAVWACHGNEVIEGHDGTWRHFTNKDGLQNDYCQSIAMTQQGDVWVGYGQTSSFTLMKNAYSDSPSFKTYKSGGSIGEAHVDFMDVDARGWIWRGSDRDYVATPQAAETGDWIPLGTSDGIPAPGGNQNAFYNDPDGSIWFAKDNSIVHFRPPDSFATELAAPSIFVSGFTAGSAPAVFVEASSRFPAGRQMAAQIGSLQFDRRKAIHIRYRLLPEQTAWQDSAGFNIPLTTHRWGRHRLQVQARLSIGAWSGIAEQSFEIATPVWATWRAVCAYLLSGGLFAFVMTRWLKKRKQRLSKAFPELSEFRLAALSPELAQLEGILIDERFEAGRLLARGGFAVVVEGWDLDQDRRRCAIKIFRQELGDKEWLARRFKHEVRALQKISHPNVVRIYGSGALPEGALYLVMEFIEGGTLRDLLEVGPAPVDRIVNYLRQIGSALDEIHAHGICHRDLKPENLMIRRDREGREDLILIDFSIAIVKDPDETLHGLSRAAGTIYYMAPEQAVGYADPSTDIYSVAKVLIELLTGKRLSELLPDAAMDLPLRVRELLVGLPVSLTPQSIELIANALEFDPARRPKEAGDFTRRIAADLETNSTAIRIS